MLEKLVLSHVSTSNQTILTTLPVCRPGHSTEVALQKLINDMFPSFNKCNKIVQTELRKELKVGERKYKTKVENLFKYKYVANTCKGPKTFSGEYSWKFSQSSMTTSDQRTFQTI